MECMNGVLSFAWEERDESAVFGLPESDKSFVGRADKVPLPAKAVVSESSAIDLHPGFYSSRRSVAGSIDSARRAGIHVATSPSNAIARTAPVMTSGSKGLA